MFTNNLSVVSLLVFLLPYVRTIADSIYTVPEPRIEIFNKGFRFSIPHEDGVELFAFHGNINKPMNWIEAGSFSKDIVKKCDDRWVFEDLTRQMRLGDVIYFWLFVIRNRLGYRYDDGEHEVKELIEFIPLNCSHLPPQKKPNGQAWIHQADFDKLVPDLNGSNQHFDTDITLSPLSPPSERNHSEMDVSVCCDLFLNVSYRLVRMAEVNRRITEENLILSTLLEKDEHLSRTLKLYGRYSEVNYPTPKDFVQHFVREILRLNNVRVIEARTIPDNGISFKLEKLLDKVKVILAAKEKLDSRFEISW